MLLSCTVLLYKCIIDTLALLFNSSFRTRNTYQKKIGTGSAVEKPHREQVKVQRDKLALSALLQRQITSAMLSMALLFIVTWMLPNQVITALIVAFPEKGIGTHFKVRGTMFIGESVGKCLMDISMLLQSLLRN